MLSALFGHERAVTGVPWDEGNYSAWGSWPGDGGSATYAGTRVDKNTAHQLLAVYGSVAFITDEIATLPVVVDGAARPPWVDEPTEGVKRIGHTGQIVWSLLMAGNAYAALIGNPATPSALDILDPDKVTVRRENGRKRAYINGQPAGVPVLHIPARMLPGALVGMSPIDWCRQTIGLGIAGQKYGAEFFDGEGNMPGVIELPHPAQPETMRDLARQWQRKRKGGGRGLPGVLQNGASWKPTGVNHEQAQFLQTRKWTSAEIAGQIFMLDPSDLGIPVEGSSLTYANLEQRNVRRLQVALMPWIRRIEAALSDLIPGGNYRFDVDSRLRGNTKESYETLKVAIEAGFMTVDEARSILGFDPLTVQEMP